MQFFDIVMLKEDIDLKMLALRLGYKRILNAGEDIGLISSLGDAKLEKNIIRSDDPEAIAKAVRNNSVIGIVAGKLRLDKKLLGEMRSEEKLLLIPLSDIVCSGRDALQDRIRMARGALRGALMSRVRVAAVSLAKSRECMLSAVQMLELAKLIGASETGAKEMLCILGDYI